jgi:hemoglobin
MFVQVETNPTSLYERVGGEPFFTALVERFYAGVQEDPVLRPLYPADLGPSIRHLALFLAQYWGGPHTYNAERGHPRLRMRHVRFSIGQSERDAWVRHMRAAVEASDCSPADAAAMLAYFEMAATSLLNQAPSVS